MYSMSTQYFSRVMWTNILSFTTNKKTAGLVIFLAWEDAVFSDVFFNVDKSRLAQRLDKQNRARRNVRSCCSNKTKWNKIQTKDQDSSFTAGDNTNPNTTFYTTFLLQPNKLFICSATQTLFCWNASHQVALKYFTHQNKILYKCLMSIFGTGSANNQMEFEVTI